MQVAAYDTVAKKMSFFEPSRAKDFLFISGTKVIFQTCRKMVILDLGLVKDALSRVLSEMTYLMQCFLCQCVSWDFSLVNGPYLQKKFGAH